MPARRIALKVDCDTFEGTKTGIPNLLRLFERMRIKASFFFTLGPDRSGRAIRRIFTQKGFIRKMFRTGAVSMYGPKTMLYGTLLPAPHIGKQLAPEIKSVAAAHEVGIHGWDHVDWHDRLGQMNPHEIKEQCRLSHEMFFDIFGRQARAMAAPGWHSTPEFLRIQDSYGLLYSSNTRGNIAHFPTADGIRFQTLEIPTTLPTWDECLASPRFRNRDALVDFYRRLISERVEVHTIHTEVEGMSYLPLFEQQLDGWISDGVAFVGLEELAAEYLRNDSIPVRQLTRVQISDRAGLVSSSEAVQWK